MRRCVGLFSLMAMMMCSQPVLAAFPDVAGHKYESSIYFLHGRDIVQGYPDGNFGPDNELTRAEMLKIILGALYDEPVWDGYQECFSDVAQERYAPYVCYAADERIVRGYGDGTFRPDQAVTVAEGLKMALLSFDTGVEEGNGTDRYEPFVDYVDKHDIFSRYAISPHLKMKRGMMSYLVHQLVLESEGRLTFSTQSLARSAGCSESKPGSAPSNILVDGVVRPIITAVGKKYKQSSPARLIVAFHGRTSSNAEVRRYYRLERAWDERDIIVYPAGLPLEGPSRNRRDGGDPSDDMRDFALFEEIVHTFSEEYCIDEDQIYVVGHSLGAWFTNTLSCTHGDIIRGMASVGGSTTYNECTGPVAALIMHNPDDRLASFAGGERARDQLLEQNGCGTATRPVGPAEGNCEEYYDCIEGAPVIWCPHSDDTAWDGGYYPHTWPNFAGQYIWDFIEDQD